MPRRPIRIAAMSLGALAVIGGAIALARPRPPAPAPAADASHPEPRAAAPAPQAASAPGPARPAADTTPAGAAARLATYPDGSTMPVLNGAKDSVTMPWPPNRPFAPVVEKIVDHGQEWYRHADGVWSTTVTRWDDAARVEQTMGQVWVPGTPKTSRLKKAG